jgi:PTS system cellobiose-specific IIC component
MEGFVNFIETHFLPIATKIGNQRHLLAVRDGVLFTIPLIIVGSIYLIVAFPPMEPLKSMATPYIGNLTSVTNVTFGLLGLFASFLIAYSLANSYKVDALSSGVLGLCAFCLAIPLKDGNLPGQWLGAQGFFVAMVLSLFTAEVYRILIQKNIVIRMPDGVPPAVSRSFAALIPAAVVITVVWSINQLLMPSGLTLPTVISEFFTKPIMGLGATLPATLIAVFFCQLLWTFGIHGTALVNAAMTPVWMGLTTANAQAKAAGLPLEGIFTQEFLNMFVLVGGSGATLALAVLLLVRVKSAQLKAVGKGAIWGSLFNINEPITFGLPIVMNPVMMIPFILAPMVLVVVTYIAMTTGFVGKTFAAPPWTCPIIFSGFLATADFKGGLLQLINFCIAGAIYYPFIMAYDKMKVKEEQAMDKSASNSGKGFTA